MSENGKNVIEIPANVTVRQLALAIDSSPIAIIKKLMNNGVMANINQLIDFDTAAIIAEELGFELVQETAVQVEETEEGEVPLWRRIILEEDSKKLKPRPPVVTILGHVDHGKTTLLDAIRHTTVASGEVGGITQHIGAYQVEHKGKLITFLDTPGHAAFTAMRARGAQGADIVVLVVAADDGVMPQTKEAIDHARAARVPIIVALNKIDRPNANPDFAKKQLADAGLVPDDWDGSTIIVPVSAKLKKGLEDLMEAILLVSENMEILANPDGRVIGSVIEAEIDRAKGVVATLLVQNGTLHTGDVIVAGHAWGKIRAMFDFRGRKLRKADPSMPAAVMGLDCVPLAGDLFQVFANEKDARALVEQRKLENQQRHAAAPKASLEELYSRFQSGETKELNLVIRADVQGSLEPIISSVRELDCGEIKVNVLRGETGNISEQDIILASASKGIVIGFNVQADTSARKLAETEGVSIRLYDIIYRLTEDIEKALKGMLEPEFKEIVIGKAEVLQLFKINKVGTIAGCRVLSGDIRRSSKVRVIRCDNIIWNGDISSLKHEKEDVREVRHGQECGIGLKNFNELVPHDIIETYVMEKSQQEG